MVVYIISLGLLLHDLQDDVCDSVTIVVVLVVVLKVTKPGSVCPVS